MKCYNCDRPITKTQRLVFVAGQPRHLNACPKKLSAKRKGKS